MGGNRIGQWARYGLVRPTYFEGRPANLYAFYDVAEAIIVHWLLDKGFSYRQIHRAIEGARKEHPEWPLQKAPLGVAQHAIEGNPRGAIVLEIEQRVWIDVGQGGEQVVLRPELLDEPG